jgi:type IV pilus assembly protein PilO
MNLKKIDLEQLKTLDFNDVGSWPMVAKAIAVSLLSVAVLFAGYWFDTRQQLDLLDQAEKKEAELKETFKAKQIKAVNLEAYKQQMADMERSFGAMLRQLPSKTEVAELLVDISQAGLANGLEFELFKPLAEVPAEFYSELPIDIKVTGHYHDFGKFVSDVAALPRIVTLHDIIISSKGDGKGGDLSMSAKAKTYRYLEEGQ